MGDTPYNEAEVRRLHSLINALNEEKLAFLVHIGDITSGQGPCTDAWFAERKEQLARIRAPVVLLPGDNDWTDCHRSGHDPVERLRKWRSLFCLSPGAVALKIERQRGEYCEHVRWEHEGLLFVALNVQGTNDNLGRTRQMDAEHAARQKAALAWLDDSESAFVARGLQGLVILMQANPFLKPRSGASGYAAIHERLRALAARHPARTTLVHGDTHTFRDDAPLPGLRRIEVHGSPFVAWTRARAAAGALAIEPGGQY